MQNKKQAFTLVELIVVITILAILGTIAFLSFQGYSKSSRDSVRLSDMGSIKKTLELYSIQTGKYPLPSMSVPMTYSGGTVWYQGTFGEEVLRNINKLNKLPLDPLSQVEYTYSIDNNKREYQVATVLESDIIAGDFNEAYAAGGVLATAYVTGNYNGLITKVSTGGIIYILAVPSIISRNINQTNISDLITSNQLVFNGYGNLPSSYLNTTFDIEGGFNNNQSILEIYTGTGMPTQSDLSAFITKLELAYSGTLLAEVSYIDHVIEANLSGDINVINQLGSDIINVSIGGNVSVKPVLMGCGVQPSYINANFIIGNPNQANQEWQNINAVNPCYYECIGGYKGVDCSTPVGPYDSCTGANQFLSDTSTHGSCNTQDIIICSGNETGYTISACNVGTNIAGTGSSSFGSFMQFGRMQVYPTFTQGNELYDNDWKVGGSSYDWGVMEEVKNTATYDSQNEAEKILMQGLCANGYHVPTKLEWENVVAAGGWGGNGTAMSNDLLLPFSGYRSWYNGSWLNKDFNAKYWSSSPDGTNGYNLFMYPSSINQSESSLRSAIFNVRCFKNY